MSISGKGDSLTADLRSISKTFFIPQGNVETMESLSTKFVELLATDIRVQDAIISEFYEALMEGDNQTELF